MAGYAAGQFSAPANACGSRDAQRAAHGVFASGHSIEQIVDLAVAYIARLHAHLSAAPVGLPQKQLVAAKHLKWVARQIMDGQTSLRGVPTEALLRPPVPRHSYQPPRQIDEWVGRLIFGGSKVIKRDQYLSDLQLDLARHTHNLGL